MPKTTSNKDFNGAECKPGIQIYSNTWSNREQQMISRIAGGRWLNGKVGLLNMAEYGG